MDIQLFLKIHGGLDPGYLEYTKVIRCPSPLYKMGQYLHTTQVHPPVFFKSLLDSL
jgi:hypothetical protein